MLLHFAESSVNPDHLVPVLIRVRNLEFFFTHFSTKTYIVGTQKNHLYETFFEHPKHILKPMGKKYRCNFTLKNVRNVKLQSYDMYM